MLNDKDMVCPLCFNRVYPGARWVNKNDGNKRHYIACCCQCDTQFEVIQFRDENKWKIETYREFENNPKPKHWVAVNRAPMPALVQTGPGGDFTKKYTPKFIGIDRATGKDCSVVDYTPQFKAEVRAAVQMIDANVKAVKKLLEAI